MSIVTGVLIAILNVFYHSSEVQSFSVRLEYAKLYLLKTDAIKRPNFVVTGVPELNPIARNPCLYAESSEKSLSTDRLKKKLSPNKESIKRKREGKGQEKNAVTFHWTDRLARATAAAIAKNENTSGHLGKERKLNNQEKILTIKNMQPEINSENLPVGSLSQLTKVLDIKLHDKGARGASGDYPALEGLVQQARDSMSSLLGHNYLSGDWRDHISLSTRNVVIVFGKTLINNQVTIEYASRIRTLVQLLKNESDLFTPSLICFCGGISQGNHRSDADAGYFFFRHLCETQELNMDGIRIFVDGKSEKEGRTLYHCTQEVRKLIPKWLQACPTTKNNSPQNTELSGQRTKTLKIHFTLISTEYHLCNINDIHHRSPQQSLLKEIEALGEEPVSYNSRSQGDRNSDHLGAYDNYEIDSLTSYKSSFNNREGELFERPKTNGIVETSWSFQYAPYPFVYSQDEVTVFLGKCFLLNEELTPLYMNMKGVIEKREFFQRDNYLMLASIRRCLVSHIEDLHVGRQDLRSKLNSHSDVLVTGNRSRGEVLEGALLHLGRCIDLVRPAGLLVSSVHRRDWLRALQALEYSMSEIRSVCDPDRPLEPAEWEKIIYEDNVM